MIEAPVRTAIPPAEAPHEEPARTGHIGRIVTGSVAAGLLGAVGLLAGPMAGAAEHVITGSVLLAFAAAWAALAVLSRRWTNQPQRWALVPAAAMASAGGAILLFAPTGNPLGWVWPPALVALVAWMVVQARRNLDSRARRWVLYPVFVALVLAAMGGSYETVSETTHAGEPAMTGRLVDVGGYRLHLDCVGTGSPTVVLEAGLGEPGAGIAGWIAPAVASTTRVCAYDRAGRGRSQSAPTAQDGNAIAVELHTLLDRAGEAGPYVLAGHSAGGLYAMSFAHLYPEEVAGLVLLDSSSPEQYRKVASFPAFYQGYRRVSAVFPSLARHGAGRIVDALASPYAELPPPARAEAEAFSSTPRSYRSLRDEFSRLRTSMTEAQALRTLDDRPLVVVTALRGAQPEWMGLQNDLLTLSTNSAHVILPDASHDTVVKDEDTASRSAAAIRDVVNAARTGGALPGSGR
jgi:pimeloyl-ACP methyl ester carboxylesterase